MATVQELVQSAEALTEEERNSVIVSVLKKHTLLGVSALIKQMEKEFGVSAASVAPMAAAAPSGAAAQAAAPPEEKTEWKIVLASSGDKKIEVIKVIRQITNLPLKEAKALVDGAPQTVKESASKEEAEKIKKDLEAAGGKVELQ